MPPRLVIFDCDGVLVDSEPVANQVLARALSRVGLVMDEAGSRRRYVGLSLGSIVARAEEELGRPLPDDFLDDLQRDTFAEFRRSLRPVPGIADAVAAVRQAGISYCVASSGTLDKMALTLGLTGLAPLFEGVIFSATMVARGKPFPDLFLHAAASMGFAPGEAVVVEDSVFGVEAGRAAGMRVLAYARDGDPAALAARGGEVFDDMARLPLLLGLSAFA